MLQAMRWLWIALLVASCKAPSEIPLDTPASPWTMGPILPDPRFEPGVTAMGQQLFVIGGFDTPTQVTTGVEVLDTQLQTWSSTLPDAPVARHDVQIAAIGTTLYFMGGLDGTTNDGDPARGDCYALNTGDPAGTWQPIAAIPAGFERGAAAVVVTPPRIYLLGGASSTGALASVIFYDSIADAWTTDQFPDLPMPRSHPAGLRRSDATFAVAGGLAGLTPDTAAADVFLLAPNEQIPGGTWTDGTAMPTARGSCAYGAVEDQLLCAGGEAGAAALTDTQGYSSINDVWSTYAAMPVARTGTPGAVIGTLLFAPGGAADLTVAPTDTLLVFSLNDTAGTR